MTAKDIIPAGFQSAPVLLAVSDLMIENELLITAIDQLSECESANGVDMLKIVDDVIKKLNEHRRSVKARNSK
jgi:hypothetical protein